MLAAVRSLCRLFFSKNTLGLWLGGLGLLFFGLRMHAQKNILPFAHYSHYDGISKKLYTICSDPDGFIWVGGDNGVFRFDGKTFHHYTVRDGLCDNEILAMFADSKGRIWCAGFNGKVSVIENGMVDTLSPFIRGWPGRELIRDFAEDSLGNLYFISENADLLRISADGRLWEKRLFGIKGSPRRLMVWRGHLLIGDDGRRLYCQQSLQDTVFTIVSMDDVDKALLPREQDAVWMLNSRTGKLRRWMTDYDVVQLPTDRNVLRYFAQFNGERALVSIDGPGVFLYNLADGTRVRVELPATALVPEVAQDMQNHLWFITPDDGLYAIRLGKDTLGPMPLAGFTEDIVATHGWQGHVFAVTRQGKCIVADPGGTRWSQWLFDSRPTLDRVHLFEARDSLYMVTARGSFVYKDRIRVMEPTANKSFLFYRDSILVARGHSLVHVRKWDREMVVYRGRSYDMCIQNDILWFSGISGLYGYDLSSDSLLGVVLAVPDNGRFESITALGSRMQVVCTSNAGVWFLHDGKKVLLKLTEENGLLENACKELDTYAGGWVLRHPSGLSRIEKDGLRVQNVSEWMGMPLSSVVQVAVAGNDLLMSTSKGLFRVNIDTLFQKLPERRRVRFSQIYSGVHSVSPLNLLLEPSGNHLRIDFSMPEYEHPERVQYRWRINDGAWNKTENSSLEFADLGPGAYRFQVMAEAPGFEATEITTLEFRVRQPFWENMLFWVSCTVVSLLLLWFLLSKRYRRKLAQERERATVRHRLLSYEQRALNAMMNPHFVFNAMGSIQYLLHDGNVGRANNYLVKFSRLVRKTLESSQKESDMLDDEIERLVLYLQMEKLRLEEKLSFTVEVEDGLDPESVQVPTMILQTYVENAVIHGMAKGSVHIDLRFGMEGNGIRVEIEDNGPGFDALHVGRRSERFGLSATEKRLALLSKITGRPYRVEVVSPVDAKKGGTRVRLYFPLVRVS